MEKLARVLKMRFQVLLPVLVVVVSLLSCTPKVKEATSIPIFSKENAVDTVTMSSLIKDWHYVMLETKTECLIGDISKMRIDDSLLFIESNASYISSIFVFNRDGKFIRKIGDKGNARNEYLSIYFWAIDKWNKEVLIGDGFKKKLMRYAYDGSYLGDIPYNDNFLDERELYVISKDRFAFQRDIPANKISHVMAGHEEEVQNRLDKVLKSQTRFLVTDRELNLVSRLSDRGIVSGDYSYSLNKSMYVDKTIYVRDPILNDTLYRFENNQFIPECLVYVDDCRATDIELEPIGDLWVKYVNEYSVFKSEQIVNNRYFFTKGNKGDYLIDLTTKSIRHLKLDEVGSLSCPFYTTVSAHYSDVLFSDNNNLVVYRHIPTISQLKESQEESNVEASSKEQELYDLIQEDSNPVIFFYELKD